MKTFKAIQWSLLETELPAIWPLLFSFHITKQQHEGMKQSRQEYMVYRRGSTLMLLLAVSCVGIST